MKSSLRCSTRDLGSRLVACLDLPEQLLNCHGTVSRYRVVIKVVFTSQHNCEHCQKKCRNKKEKSLKMKRDVGMACQKVYKQGRIKVIVNIQSPIPTPLLFCEKM